MKTPKTLILLLLIVGFAFTAFSQEWRWRNKTNIELSIRTFNQSNYQNNLFNRRADFRRTIFISPGDFVSSHFKREVSFWNSKFKSTADFKNTIFDSHADFSLATFQSMAYFQGKKKFHSLADFAFATFNASADFSHREFDTLADFSRAKFLSTVVFDSVYFYSLDIKLAEFHSTADFRLSQFYLTADFEQTKFFSTVDFYGVEIGSKAMFDQVEFYSYAEFKYTVFHSEAVFTNAAFDSVEFYDSKFLSLADFKNAQFKSAMFENVAFNSLVDFFSAKFGENADFKGATFNDRTAFGGATLPKYLDFSKVIKIANEIDFTASVIDTNNKICNINLTGSAIDKIRFRYKRFKLWFPEENSVGYELKANVYQQLLEKQKAEGFTQSYEILDKEYREFQYTDPESKYGKNKYWHFWGKTLNWVEKYWWGYGYNKELIILNTLLLFLILSFINSFFLKYLITQVYSNEKIRKLIEKRETKNGFVRWFDSLRYSIFYTAVIFFSFNFDLDKLNYAGNLDGWKVFNLTWFMLIYLGGVVCMAYLANFIISV